MFQEMFKRLFSKQTQKKGFDYIFVIVDGSFSVGKSQFIRMCSEIELVSTGELSDVALDFGRKTLHDENICFYFFAPPGTRRMPDITTKLMERSPAHHHRCGSIILVHPSKLLKPKGDWDRFHPLEEALSIIETTQERQIPFIVAMNERKDTPTMPPEMLHAILELDPKIPVLTCNAKEDKRSCELVLLNCLEQLPQDKIVAKAIEHIKKTI